MATGGLVPPLLEPLASPPGGGAPILRARLLEILRVLYEHHPRPKEFIMKFRIQVGARSRMQGREVFAPFFPRPAGRGQPLHCRSGARARRAARPHAPPPPARPLVPAPRTCCGSCSSRTAAGRTPSSWRPRSCSPPSTSTSCSERRRRRRRAASASAPPPRPPPPSCSSRGALLTPLTPAAFAPGHPGLSVLAPLSPRPARLGPPTQPSLREHRRGPRGRVPLNPGRPCPMLANPAPAPAREPRGAPRARRALPSAQPPRLRRVIMPQTK
jgi:hypothetical protein